MTEKIESKNDTSIELAYCENHNFGSVIKDTPRQKEYIKNSKGKCKFVEYDPKKHISKYEKSKIDEKNIPKDSRSQSRILFDYAMSNIEKLYIQENDREEVYALIPINNHTEFINISSSRFLNWLSDSYSKIIDTDDIYGEDFYKKVYHAIESRSKINISERTQFHNRIAQLDDSVWYDLGNEDYTAVKVTKKKVDIVKLDVNTPFFERTQSTYQQFQPKYDNQNALQNLAELLKIKPLDYPVFISHVVCFLLSSIPIPIMVFTGTAGSIKTTATATIKRIVDPSGISKLDNVSAISKKPDDLIVQLAGEYMSSFDNVSHVDNDTSDIFSRAITGATNVKRKLYKNKERVMLKFMSKIILNGVIPALEQPDLQTRIINYERLIIDDSNRILEKDFEKILQTLIPQVLGNIFTILSKALQDYPKLSKKIKPKERMSDFEVWGEIISRRYGFEKNEFLNRYHDKLKHETIKSQDAYPIISAIQNLMSGIEVYENSATELYSRLCYISESMGVNIKDKFTRFPKGSNKLVNHLKTVESNIRTTGFDITFYHYTKHDGKFVRSSSMVKISKKEQQTSLTNNDSKRPLTSPTPSTIPKNTQKQAQNPKNIVEGTVGDTHKVEGTVGNKKENPRLKNVNSRNKNRKVEAVEGVGDTFDNHSSGKTKQNKVKILKESKYSHFKCLTCNSEDFEIISSDILENHKKQGHSIQYFNKKGNNHKSKSKVKSHSTKKEPTKSFNCKNCSFGSFINLDSKSILDKTRTYYELHKKANPDHILEYSDEVMS